MLKQLAHVCIMSTDLEATERFYCDLFGLKKSFVFYKGDEVFGFYLGLENRTFIEVFFNGNTAVQDNTPINHLCLEVADLDAVIAHVRANHYEITDKKKGCDNTWQAWLNDPSGVRIELFEYTAVSSQFNGQDCQVDW
jgi:catechol 2,3-dioxygenase-like lactoylglutathione lyase family enzyme